MLYNHIPHCSSCRRQNKMVCGKASVKEPPTEVIPHVTHDPKQVLETVKALREGIAVKRVTSSGKMVERSLVLDRAMDYVTYSPSQKNLSKRQMTMADIRSIRSTIEGTPELDKANLRSTFHAVAIVTKDARSMSVVVDSAEQADMLCQALAYLVRKKRVLRDESSQRMRVVDLWMETDLDANGELSFDGLITAAQKLGITYDRDALRTRFKQIDTENKNTLSYVQFCEFVDHVTLRPELQPLFLHYVSDSVRLLMRAEDLQRFLQHAQGEKVSLKTAKALVNAIGADPDVISFSEFCQFLTNPRHNTWFKPAHQKVFQDMTQPLHHYYIASSHNSSVIGEQVKAEIDPSVIRVALSTGCRAVELEIGDGPSGPVVFRAFSNSESCPAETVLSAIAESAFVASEFPVIIMLELFTSAKQTQAFADMMHEIFGKLLYTLDSAEADDYLKFSPEALKHRILVTYKITTDEPDFHKETTEMPTLHAVRSKSTLNNTKNDDLCHLAFFATRNHDVDWGKSAEAYYVGSYPSSRIPIAYSKKKFKFTAMNRRMFTRTYPVSEDSSNYDPLPGFAMGVQLQSMNYQTWDDHMRVYDSRFQLNGRCGYVLKPEFLRNSSVLPSTQPYLLSVNVLLGTQLARPENKASTDAIKAAVCVRLIGVPEDTETNLSCTTKALEDSATEPFWNETFDFTTTNVELASVALRLVDREDSGLENEIGEAIVPLLSLRLGYRAIPLFSCFTGKALPNTSILCHFRIRRTDDQEEVLDEWLSKDVAEVVK